MSYYFWTKHTGVSGYGAVPSFSSFLVFGADAARTAAITDNLWVTSGWQAQVVRDGARHIKPELKAPGCATAAVTNEDAEMQ